MTHIWQQLERLLGKNFHMLWSRHISQLHSLKDILSYHNKPILFNRSPCNFLTRKFRKLLFSLNSHLFSQLSTVSNNNAGRQHIMLSLAKHISCCINRISSLISYYQYFTRSSQHINIAVTIHSLLSQGNKYIARSRNLINSRNCLCSKGHSSNSLSTAYLENP